MIVVFLLKIILTYLSVFSIISIAVFPLVLLMLFVFLVLLVFFVLLFLLILFGLLFLMIILINVGGFIREHKLFLLIGHNN